MAGFASHRLVAPQVYVELTGVDFEDFAVGQVFEHRPGRTLGGDENALHAARSLDLSPRHADRRYGELVGEPPSIYEPFLLAVVTGLTTKTFGKVVANLGWTGVTFPRPVRPGDTVYAESEILETRGSRSRPAQGILRVRTRALNQRGEEVCRFERSLLLYRRGHGPHADAGY